MKHSPTLYRPTALLTPESRDAHNFAAAADAPNTQRAYTSDWKHFLSWCSKRNRAPLPASPEDVAIYLRFCAQTLKRKISTVQRKLASIAEAHKRNGHESPTGAWIVKNTMRRLRRELGTPARGKEPILVEDLKRMVALCPPTLAGARDKAILLIGFSGAFRRSELVGLDIEDIGTADEGLVLTIRKGKTDQKREGRKIGIPFGEAPLTCPVRALAEWVDAAQIEAGPLFRAVTKLGRPRHTRLSDRTVAEIVKDYCSLIGKRTHAFSGHSLRAGLVTSAAIAGASERSIQKQTGHKSLVMLRRYVRDAEMFRENAITRLL